ncbi:MAG: translation initiation factor IF-2 N-terminal domain-containing protein [Bacteroidetes bacterium]|nr:translation initiation factor IF-2 N-terminal domain-containing protein [Bacteroidota bacterium]
MVEVKSKKIRIYKLASEYNLSADSIVEFLSGEGFKVKSHMSNLNEEMISAVQEHFKKDIEKTQKHYQKLAEFKKIREDKARKDEEVVEDVDEEAIDEKKETEEVKVSDVPAEKKKIVARETKVKERKVKEDLLNN